MNRYTAEELSLMATIMTWEAANREVERERCVMPCPEFRQDIGRVPGQLEDDGIDCADLAARIQQHADEVKNQKPLGLYRGKKQTKICSVDSERCFTPFGPDREI